MNAEYSLINAVITQGHIIPLLKRIDASFFDVELHKNVYLLLLDYYNKFKKVAPSSVIKQKYPDFEPIEENGQIDFFIDEIIQKKCERRLTSILSESVNKLREGKSQEVIEYISSEVKGLKNSIHTEEDIDITKNTERRLDRYIQTAQGANHGLIGITSGFKSVDNLTGGFKNGELIVVMAPTGTGKSFLCTHFARAAWLAGYKPLYISLEMSDIQISYRFDALITGLKHKFIKHAQLNEEDLTKYKKHLQDIKEGRPSFIISNPSRCTQNTVYNKILEHKPDICVVDYISLMQDEKKNKDWQAVDSIMKDLKNIANDKQISIPIIAIAQVNRGFDRNSQELPQLDDVARSDSISHHADIVIAIHQNTALKDECEMLFGIIKQRDEENMQMKLHWDLRNSIIEEPEEQTATTATTERTNEGLFD